jgi:hypothetical protein
MEGVGTGVGGRRVEKRRVGLAWEAGEDGTAGEEVGGGAVKVQLDSQSRQRRKWVIFDVNAIAGRSSRDFWIIHQSQVGLAQKEPAHRAEE